MNNNSMLLVKYLTKKHRKIIRAESGFDGTTYPILIVSGDKPPQKAGRSFRWETRGGQKIRHPSAYSRKGWSNMIYVASTNRIEVGWNWLKERKEFSKFFMDVAYDPQQIMKGKRNE